MILGGLGIYAVPTAAQCALKVKPVTKSLNCGLTSHFKNFSLNLPYSSPYCRTSSSASEGCFIFSCSGRLMNTSVFWNSDVHRYGRWIYICKKEPALENTENTLRDPCCL